jgi:carboxynorspermidine decarboxylase
LDEAALRRNLAVIDRVRAESGAEVIVALKACAMWSVFPELARHSDGATASSYAEARLVFEEYGVSGNECGQGRRGSLAHTYAPVYTDVDFDEILRCSSHVTFNSVAQFERFGARALLRGISCGLRVNPGWSPVETDLYNPALAGSRLGVSELSELPDGVEGLHFHVLCESSAADLARALEAFEGRFGHLLEDDNPVPGERGGDPGSGGKGGLKWVNCGGGHLMTREGYDVELLIEAIKQFKARHPGVRVILEPGSAFTWRTGHLVSTVEDVVESGGCEPHGQLKCTPVRTAMLDVSFACHMPDCLEMPYKPSIVGARDTDTAKGERGWRMGGCSCLAGDWMGEWTFEDGRELRVGDRVVFEDMIHYTMVKTTMFNGVRHPSIAILRADQSDTPRLEIIKRFGYEDYKNRMS